MNENKPVKQIKPLYGCDFSDSERVNTLADADWLTRRLTALYRDRIMTRILGIFHKAPTFAITLDTFKDESTREVKSAKFLLTGLWMGDRAISDEAEDAAKAELKKILQLDRLEEDTPEGIRTMMEAVSRDIPGIREYYEF